jgi:hypothetical protein
MIPDKVIYTDGHDVVVTESTLKVKNTSYRLNGITKLSLWTIRPDVAPGIILLLIGIAGIVAGYMDLLPASMNWKTETDIYSGNQLAIWIGTALGIIGILILALSRKRYAVRIATAEGEKNAVVSTKREYISQIVDAMNNAFDLGVNTPTVMVKK